MLSNMIHEQGESINNVLEMTQNSADNTVSGVNDLKTAKDMTPNNLNVLRNIAIVVGGCVLGSVGFILGPFIGLSTVIAGASLGGATAYGVDKIIKK